MNNIKLKVVCSKWLAEQLCEMGFEIIGTSENINAPNLSVFYFKDTPEIQASINSIKRRKSNGEISKSNNSYDR